LDYIDDFDLDYVIKKVKNSYIELHYVSEDIDLLKKIAAKDKFNKIFVQLEKYSNILEIKNLTKKYPNLFPAITVTSPIEKYTKLIKNSKEVLLMTTTPGVSNLKFNEKVYSTIEEVLTINDTIKITVDGGVNEINFLQLKNSKVHSVVMGSYLAKTKDILNNLQGVSLTVNLDTYACQLALSAEVLCSYTLPSEKNLTVNLFTILKIMNAQRSNFILILSKSHEIKGIITDGDIKRFLESKKKFDLFNARIKYNRKFYFARGDQKISEIITQMQITPNLGAVPIEEDGKIASAIDIGNI
jgi:pentose-5-phosphate-3-epimerase